MISTSIKLNFRNANFVCSPSNGPEYFCFNCTKVFQSASKIEYFIWIN
ncbi:hypothetical protein Sent08_01754 [Salmonella enterica]